MHRRPRRRAALLAAGPVVTGPVPAGLPVTAGLVAAALVVTGLLAGCGQQPPVPAQPSGTPPDTASGPPPTGAPSAAPTGAPTPAPLPLPRPQPPEGPKPPQPGLDAADRARLIAARRVGAQWVTLLVTTEPARTTEVRAGLQRLGGVLGTGGPDDGYLRLTMPTGQVERAAALPGITALDIEQVISPRQPRPTG